MIHTCWEMNRLLIIILSVLYKQTLTETSYLSSSAANQLPHYAETHTNNSKFAETVNGHRFPSLTASLTVCNRGPVLLQDTFLVQSLQMFNRERIPQRVVHVKGAGALGYFEVTNPEIMKYTKADFLQPGRRTKVMVRFSLSVSEGGAPDTSPDTKGIGVKFYTKDGIHDITTLQVPVFFTSDAMLFPQVIRASKRNPATNLVDQSALADLTSQVPEMALFLLLAITDTGRPKSYRSTRGSAINTFKMVNACGEAVYVKFHFIPHQKEEFYTVQEMVQMFALNADTYIQDLYDHIAKKDYPKWTLYIQVMTFEQAKKHYDNPFDATKLWTTEEFPLIPVGIMTLNENPTNNFNQVEQAAFAPSNMVRGIEASPDRLLHARMFAYADAQLYRLGANHAQIPVNSCPFKVNTYERDGFMNVGRNGDGAPYYFPNSFHGLRANTNPSYTESVDRVCGDVKREDLGGDHFTAAQKYYKEQLNDEERQRVKETMVAFMIKADRSVQTRLLNNIVFKISKDLGDFVKAVLQL